MKLDISNHIESKILIESNQNPMSDKQKVILIFLFKLHDGAFALLHNPASITIETLEKGVKHVQSLNTQEQRLVFLLLTLNM